MVSRLILLTIFVTSVVPLFSSASSLEGREMDLGCRSKVASYLEVGDPLGLVENHTKLINQFQYIDCTSLNTSIITAIHEAVHFTDHSVSSYTTFPQSIGDIDFARFRLIALDGQTYPAGVTHWPAPQDILQEIVPSSVSEDDLYRTYIRSNSVMSAHSHLGILSEINAYVHGIRAATALQSQFGIDIPTLQPDRAATIFFVYLLDKYFEQVFKQKSDWLANLKNSQPHKELISNLLNSVIALFGTSKYCETSNDSENYYLALIDRDLSFPAYSKFLDKGLIKKLSQALACDM